MSLARKRCRLGLSVTVSRRATLISAIVLFAACDKSLPTAPSDWSTGIIIYEHANYLGGSALIDKDITNLNDYKGPCVETTSDGQGGSDTNHTWRNCISSIRVALGGWKAIVYTDTNYHGKSYEISADVPNLQLVPGDCSHDGFNDCIESIRIIHP
jgi:hypothetical protein